MNMKLIPLLFIIFASLIAAGAVYAGIAGSKHDFSMDNQSGSTQYAGWWGPAPTGFVEAINEICVFCHTPHGSSSNVGVLWNRINTETAPAGFSYELYRSATFTTGPSSFDQLSAVSRMCMSCHDGVTSIGYQVMINPPGNYTRIQIELDPDSGLIGEGDRLGAIGSNTPYVGANIGNWSSITGGSTIDLRNDHPISMPIPGRQGYRTPSNQNLRLFNGGKVECATCHNVHSNAIPPFLSMDNSDRSAMCFQCHDK